MKVARKDLERIKKAKSFENAKQNVVKRAYHFFFVRYSSKLDLYLMAALIMYNGLKDQQKCLVFYNMK